MDEKKDGTGNVHQTGLTDDKGRGLPVSHSEEKRGHDVPGFVAIRVRDDALLL